MGGNGARSHFLAGTLDGYHTVRFKQVGDIDGVKVVTPSNQSNSATPMESFTSKMYYVSEPAKPGKNGKPGTPERIKTIAFYDKDHNIKVSIDIKYDKDGKPLPYTIERRKGRDRVKGCHMHKWGKDSNGDNGRDSHDPRNCFEVNKYYMRFVNKALKYNKDHEK